MGKALTVSHEHDILKDVSNYEIGFHQMKRNNVKQMTHDSMKLLDGLRITEFRRR